MTASIKLFQFAQKCHHVMGIRPCNPNQQQHSTNWTKMVFLISFAQFFLISAAFLLLEAKSMFDYGLVFYSLDTIINCIAIYLIFIWQSENTLEFIENCEKFIEKRVHSSAAYKGLIGKIELFHKYFCIVMAVTNLQLVLGIVPYSYARYYIFSMDEDSFYVLFPVWFPFDWKTPVGYLVACLAECAIGMAVGSVICQFLNFIFGSCWLFIFIAEDITQDVAAFNTIARTASNDDRTELTKHFCDMAQIYSDAKQCVMEFNHVFKYSLFAFFAWDMLSASSLLITIQFELWADELNLFEILLLILILNWVIIIIFLLCEPGERIINQFDGFSDELNRCDWYLLPIVLQHWYIIFLSDTQHPIEVLSYANIACKRETSKKMINTAFSYFMTFRKFRP